MVLLCLSCTHTESPQCSSAQLTTKAPLRCHAHPLQHATELAHDGASAGVTRSTRVVRGWGAFEWARSLSREVVQRGSGARLW